MTAEESTWPVALDSDIGWSDPERIVIRGIDLCDELIGQVDLGSFAYLELRGRLPDASEARMFNALLVTIAEHGITPSVLAARMTYLGAPEAMQAAVAAGLLGVGTAFVGTVDQVARVLLDARQEFDGEDSQSYAAVVANRHRDAQQRVPGLGHPIHHTADPRVGRLFQVAGELGYYGWHVRLQQALSHVVSERLGRPVPVNAAGAVGAIATELGFAADECRAIAILSRSVGLVAHVVEEARSPIAKSIWLGADSAVRRGKMGE